MCGRQSDLVVVCTMGRVASSSVQRSVADKLDARVHHVHSMNPQMLAKQVAAAGSVDQAARSVQDGLTAVTDLLSHPGRVKIITLVRDAVDRNLSAAFESLRRQMDIEQLDAFLDDAERIYAFWANFYDRRPHVWFDNEILSTLDIDVFEYPFPGQGFVSITKGRCDLLTMRSELSDTVKASALAGFLGLEDVPLRRYNQRSLSRKYYRRYQRFRHRVPLDRSYLEAEAKSRYMQHFYPWSIDRYVSHWGSPTNRS